MWLTSLIFPKKDIQVKEETVRLYQGRASIFGGLLVVMILGIFSIIPYGFAAEVVLVIVLLMKKSLLKQVDYRLLITFVSFFVIVGNIQTQASLFDLARPYFQEAQYAFLGSFFFSQFLSNVPAAIFMAPFTSCSKAVLLGVNVGGLGILIYV